MTLTVVQLLPALEAGGVERGTVEIAEALVRRGHRAVVVAAGGRLAAELEAAGAEHVPWPIGRKHPLVLALVPRLRRLFLARRADVVHARSRLPAWLAWLALGGIAPTRRPAFVTTVHGPYTVNRYSAIMTRGERIIAISSFIRDYVLANYPQVDPARVELIHHGIDPARWPHGYRPPATWRAAWARALPVDGRFVVTMPARVTRWKGQAHLIDMAAALVGRGVPVLALVVGGVAPRRRRFLRELEGEVRRRGLADSVRFLGDRSDVREILAASDAVVSLTREPEAFGRTTLEALSLGTPVVGFAHGGTAEILAALYPQGLCPPGDIDAVVARLARLHAAPERVPPHDRFRLRDTLDRTIALYESLAGGAGQADQRS